MQTCPTFNNAKFDEELIKINNLTNKKFEQDLTICPIEGGKKRGKKMQGGAITKEQIKTAIYVILAILVAISLTGDGVQSGISMIAKGECGYLKNRLFFQNPFCTFWNNLITMVGTAIHGNLASIGMLTAASAALVSAPKTVDAIVDGMATRIASSETTKSIKNGGKKSKKHGKKRSRRTRRNRK